MDRLVRYLLFCLVLPVILGEENHHKLLLVSFDGLRWDYTEDRLDLEGFQYLKDNGVQAEYLVPPFPTMTSPSHTTIATGYMFAYDFKLRLTINITSADFNPTVSSYCNAKACVADTILRLYTENHGVVHNVHYNRSDNYVVTGDFYRTLAYNDWWDNGYEPIWITASSQGLKSGGYLYPGSNTTIGGKTATRSILETITTPKDEKSWQYRIDDVMSWFKDDGFDFIALYFEEVVFNQNLRPRTLNDDLYLKPDSSGHNDGPDSEGVRNEALPLVDRTIKYLLEKTQQNGLEDDLNIIITSDHGMTRINTTVRGDDVIATLNYVDDADIFFQFPYAAIALIEPYPDKLEKVYKQLQDADQRMRVFYKEDVPERLHYANNDRVTSIVLMADLGYTIYRKFPGIHINTGDHGFDNEEPDMFSSFYAIGPSFKKNFKIPGFESIHIYELMCHLLGLNPAPNNGSLTVLSPSLSGFSVLTPSVTTLATFSLILSVLFLTM